MSAFDFTGLKTVDISTLEPGQFFATAPRRAGVPHSVGVRCGSVANTPFATVLLSTPQGLELTDFRVGERSGITAITIEVTDLRFEIPDESRSVMDGGDMHGLLLVTPQSGYLSVRSKDSRFERWETAYLNLTTWTDERYQPAECSVFPAWTLVGQMHGERVILLSQAL